MKYADRVGDTDRNRGGSKTLTGMLLNQINGLKLLHTSSSQCSGHHVQLRNHCIVGVEFFPTSSHEVTIGTILKKKKRDPLVLEMTCLFHCFQLQMICSNFVTDVDRCRCRRPNLAYIIWFSFGLRLCGCTSHCQAEGGKCMGPDRWKFAFPGPGLGQLSMQASEIIRDSIRTRSVPRFRDFTGSRGPELGFRSQLPLRVWSYAMSRLGIPYHLCSVVRSCYDSTCGEAKRFD